MTPALVASLARIHLPRKITNTINLFLTKSINQKEIYMS